MGCRKGLLFCLGLLAASSGCTFLHETGEVRKDAPAPAGERVVKRPETCVAFGDYRKAAAFAPETRPEDRQTYCMQARMAYLKAIEIEPGHVPAYLALARLQQANDELAPALETYKKALAVTTKDATIWYEFGMCQARQKRFDEAAASIRKACELRPDDKPCRETLGYTLARAGRWAEAQAALTGVVGEAQAQFALARMLTHLNRPDEARKYVVAALSRDPELPGARELFVSLGGTLPATAARPGPAPTRAVPTPSARAPRVEITAVEGPAAADIPPAPRGTAFPDGSR